jgi:hypothetical protein
MILIKNGILITLITMLMACGGGSNDSENTPTPNTPTPNTPTPNTPTPNTPPILNVSVSSVDIDEVTTQEIPITFSDSNGDTISITVTSTNSNNVNVSYISSSNILSLTAGNVESNLTETVTVTATDGNGGSASRELIVNILNINLPPIIKINNDETSYTLDEGTFIETFFVITDPENDIINLNITTDNSLLQVTYIEDQEILLIEAGNVQQDQTVNVNIVATDSNKMTSELDLVIFIKKVVIPNIPPEIILLDRESSGIEPNYIMGESTRYGIPFRVDDPDTSIEDMSFTVISNRDGGGLNADNNIEFQFNIDKENGLLEIIAGQTNDYFDHTYNIEINVSDGETFASTDFRLKVRETSSLLNLFTDKSSFYITQGQSVVVNYEIFTSNPDNIVIDGVKYLLEIDNTEQPFDIVVNEDDQTITFTAKDVTTDRLVPLRFDIRELGVGVGGLAGRGMSIDISLKTQLSDIEQSLINRINEVKYFFEFTSEQEEIIYYLSNIYIVQSLYGDVETGITYEQALSQIDALVFEADLKTLDINSYLNFINSLDNKLADLFNPDTSSDLRVSRIQSELDNLDIYETITKDTNWYSFLNIDSGNLLELAELDSQFTNFDHEVMVELPNGKFSRYVGNTKYGSYVDGVWVFADVYKYMSYPLSKYLEMEIR